MNTSVHAGFTIIESMLFLAISALVFVIGFAGIGARLEAVRYTDSVRNLESDVETVFRNTDDGLNLRDAAKNCVVSGKNPVIDTGSTELGQGEQCAVAGVDINFQTATPGPGAFTTDALAVATGQNNVSGSEFSFFSPEQINSDDFDVNEYLANAATIPGTGGEYPLQWGLEYIGFLDSADDLTNRSITVRYIRSPISPQTFIYSYRDIVDPAQLSDPLRVCFADASGRTAALTFQPNATVDVTYQVDACAT